MCCIPALSPVNADCAQARLLGGRDGGLLAAIARDAGAAARLNALSARDRPAAANLNDEIAALEGPPVAVMAALRELGQVLHSPQGPRRSSCALPWGWELIVAGWKGQLRSAGLFQGLEGDGSGVWC